MPTRKPKFSAELRRLRDEAGLTREQLGKSAKVDPSTIWAAENDTRATRGSIKHRLLEVLAKSGNNTMPHKDVGRVILAVERLALAAERIANALESHKKK